jgi:hypothetical protein
MSCRRGDVPIADRAVTKHRFILDRLRQRVLDRVSLAVQLRGLLVEKITGSTGAEPDLGAEWARKRSEAVSLAARRHPGPGRLNVR